MTMTHREREEQALDALIASFFHISSEDDVGNVDDPAILDDEDRRALEALGGDLIDRLIAEKGADEALPPDVVEEIEQHKRELLEDEEADFGE